MALRSPEAPLGAACCRHACSGHVSRISDTLFTITESSVGERSAGKWGARVGTGALEKALGAAVLLPR